MISYSERGFSADLGPVVAGYGLEDDEVVMAALRALAPGIVLLHRLREQALDGDLVWLLPSGFLPGAVQIYGVPVVGHGAAPSPMLAHRVAVSP